MSYLISNFNDIKTNDPSIKKMVENAQKVMKLVCGKKVKRDGVFIINEDSLKIGLSNGVICVNVYFSADEIKIERHISVYDEFNGDTINGAVDLLKKWFSEHSESKGYICLEM